MDVGNFRSDELCPGPVSGQIGKSLIAEQPRVWMLDGYPAGADVFLPLCRRLFACCPLREKSLQLIVSSLHTITAFYFISLSCSLLPVVCFSFFLAWICSAVGTLPSRLHLFTNTDLPPPPPIIRFFFLSIMSSSSGFHFGSADSSNMNAGSLIRVAYRFPLGASYPRVRLPLQIVARVH